MQLDQPVGCVAPRANGGLILGLKDGCALIDAWGEPPRPFGPQMLAGMAEQRCNDACVDSAGRFWIGSVTSDTANPADRKSLVSGKRVSVRVDRGGRGINKKK